MVERGDSANAGVCAGACKSQPSIGPDWLPGGGRGGHGNHTWTRMACCMPGLVPVALVRCVAEWAVLARAQAGARLRT